MLVGEWEGLERRQRSEQYFWGVEVEEEVDWERRGAEGGIYLQLLGDGLSGLQFVEERQKWWEGNGEKEGVILKVIINKRGDSHFLLEKIE